MPRETSHAVSPLNNVTCISKLRLKLLEVGGPDYMIAARCGFPPTRLSEYATGKRKIPVNHLLELCKVLECKPDEILGEAEDNDSPLYMGFG